MPLTFFGKLGYVLNENPEIFSIFFENLIPMLLQVFPNLPCPVIHSGLTADIQSGRNLSFGAFIHQHLTDLPAIRNKRVELLKQV